MNKGYKETDKYIYFYGSFFSQWAMRDMIIDGEKYNCCEQFMMVKKARLYGDCVNAIKIMDRDNPSVQKSLGRKVKNFDKDKWDNISRKVVYEANYAKFTQNEDLKNILLDTEDKIIVEASPYDCIWGVGLKADDKRILNPNNWRGTNWLGEEIMKVRDKINEEIIEDIERQLKETTNDPDLILEL